MSRSIHDQTLALAGVFQASALVQQIAHSGQCAESSFETCLRSLFATQPETTLDVFGGELKDLREGLSTLASVMSQQSKQQDIEVLRYALNLINLSSKLRQNSDMLDVIGSRIDPAHREPFRLQPQQPDCQRGVDLHGHHQHLPPAYPGQR